MKSIPLNAVGSLDLPTLRPGVSVWRSTYRLPFRDIASFEFTGPGARGSHPHLGQVPLPSLRWAKSGRERTLNLSYRTLGTVGVMSFKLMGKEFANAEWIMKTRTESSQEQARGENRAKLPESWWGDRYWKTNRNNARWGGLDPDAQSGTK